MLNKSMIKASLPKNGPDPDTAFWPQQIVAFMRLFKIAPYEVIRPDLVPTEPALKKGVVFISPEGEVLRKVPSDILDCGIREFGYYGELFNQTFYKSFGTVEKADPIDLLFDQLTHYFTTYSAASLGIQMPIYVPTQELKIPEAMVCTGTFNLVAIQVKYAKDCLAQLDKYLTSVASPSRTIIGSMEHLLPYSLVPTKDIKSFEIQAMSYDLLGEVPQNPISQLRYLVYTTTGSTLLIKDRGTCDLIKNLGRIKGTASFDILSKCNLHELSSIFFRYKPLFLAFKSHEKCAPIINKLRRLANATHRPLAQFSVQNLTSVADFKTQLDIIEKASNRDIIKVMNSIQTRLSADSSTPMVFAIRNGKTFIKEGNDNPIPVKDLQGLRTLLESTIKSRLSPTLTGKVFYIPKYILYAAPTSEKQFTGDIPFGSCIRGTTDGSFTFGVHWFNQGEQTDIDLHLNSPTRHFGWNSDYCSEEGHKVIYSGDQTSAPLPLGAAEAFFLEDPKEEPFIVSAHLYSGATNCEYKMFMTHQGATDVDCSYRCQPFTYDPNLALFPAIPLKFHGDDRDATLGMFIDGNFWFYGGRLSAGIVPKGSYRQFIEGLAVQLANKVSLNSLIEECGGIVITSLDGLSKAEIDKVISLAPEDVTVGAFMNIIDGIE